MSFSSAAALSIPSGHASPGRFSPPIHLCTAFISSKILLAHKRTFPVLLHAGFPTKYVFFGTVHLCKLFPCNISGCFSLACVGVLTGPMPCCNLLYGCRHRYFQTVIDFSKILFCDPLKKPQSLLSTGQCTCAQHYRFFTVHRYHTLSALIENSLRTTVRRFCSLSYSYNKPFISSINSLL